VLLPEIIRRAVVGDWGQEVAHSELFSKNNLKLSYGIAVELARLQEDGLSERELIEYMATAFLSKVKVSEFRKTVNKILADKEQGFLGFMTSKKMEADKRAHFRHTIGEGESQILGGWEAWLERLFVLVRAGLFGKMVKNSLFASPSAKKRLARICELCLKANDALYLRQPPIVRQRVARMREMATSMERRTRQTA
jgi:hypothetical protein